MDRDERKEVDTLKQKVQEISEQQRMTRKIANVKYIAVEFDYKQYKNGEKEVNDAISHGYEVIENYKTESGIVVVLGLYRFGAVYWFLRTLWLE